MAVRASIETVRSLLGDDDANVWPFMTLASEMVDELLASSGLSTTMLRQIEAYLACHIYAQGTPDVVRESYAGATFEYPRSANSGEGLCATKWGQMALQLDTTGTLRNLERTRVEIHLI